MDGIRKRHFQNAIFQGDSMRTFSSAEQILWRMTPDEMGRFGECVWKNFISSCGFSYVPLCDIDTGVSFRGPRLIGCDAVLPDFDITTGRRRAYMDSKCKKQYVVYRNANNEKRHGIDAKYADAYRSVQEINRQKALLGIVELFEDGNNPRFSGTLLANTLNGLGNPIPGYSNQNHMVYWPHDRFIVIAILPIDVLVRLSLEPVEIPLARDAMKLLIESPEEIQTVLW